MLIIRLINRKVLLIKFIHLQINKRRILNTSFITQIFTNISLFGLLRLIYILIFIMRFTLDQSILILLNRVISFIIITVLMRLLPIIETSPFTVNKIVLIDFILTHIIAKCLTIDTTFLRFILIRLIVQSTNFSLH